MVRVRRARDHAPHGGTVKEWRAHERGDRPVGIRVSDRAASRRMYAAALAELGFTVLGEGVFEGDAYVLCRPRPTGSRGSVHATS